MNRSILVILCFAGVCAAAWPAEQKVTLANPAKQVEHYAKTEFTIGLDAEVENPFNPAELDLRLEIVGPDGKTIVLPAFYYQPFERKRVGEGRRAREWIYPLGSGVWKARFAPPQVGAYSCRAILRRPSGETMSAPLTFTCVASGNPGYVRVSPKSPRHFAFDSGATFFPIGQNVAFIRDTYETDDIFGKMAAQGANYARVWACCEDWAMAIESRKSLWGRSWTKDWPIVPMPGNPELKCVRIGGDSDKSVGAIPTRQMAVCPGTTYRLEGKVKAEKSSGLRLSISGIRDSKEITASPEWTRFTYEFTTGANQDFISRFDFRLTGEGDVWLRNLSLREASGGPEMFWEADVNRPVRGWYNQEDCFMLDNLIESAERHGIYMQLVVLTRDEYMKQLQDPKSPEYDEAIEYAQRLLRYAVARWGYSPHVAAWEYVNEMNPGLPTDRFYAEAGQYLEKTDPYRHLRATSAWSAAKKDWRHRELDTADLHFYMRPSSEELFKDAFESVTRRAAFLLENAKGRPAMLSEFGVTDDKWRLSPRLEADREYVHLHNGLWTSVMAGLSGSAMSWFWEKIEARDAYHHYRPLATFVADIPFAEGNVRSNRIEVSDGALRGLSLQTKNAAWLWISDSRATWWTLGVEGKEAPAVSGASVVVAGLEPGTYEAQWLDSWTGKTMETHDIQVSGESITLKIPTFSRDIACRVLPKRK